MMLKFGLALLLAISFTKVEARPLAYTDLLRYVQAGPDQGETNTCWFVASTGAMELLLNKQNRIKFPKIGGKYDLSESFIIYQNDYYDEATTDQSWLESVVLRFNHKQAVHNKFWPFNAYYPDGTDSQEAWFKHPEFDKLPRMKVPALKTELLFMKGRGKWATEVLEPADLELMKTALLKKKSPLIVNYNDDGFWHVVLIVGFDDRKQGTCYELEKEECNKRGSFYVRDSDGKRYEARAYNWFLKKGNSAAVVELK